MVYVLVLCNILNIDLDFTFALWPSWMLKPLMVIPQPYSFKMSWHLEYVWLIMGSNTYVLYFMIFWPLLLNSLIYPYDSTLVKPLIVFNGHNPLRNHTTSVAVTSHDSSHQWWRPNLFKSIPFVIWLLQEPYWKTYVWSSSQNAFPVNIIPTETAWPMKQKHSCFHQWWHLNLYKKFIAVYGHFNLQYMALFFRCDMIQWTTISCFSGFASMSCLSKSVISVWQCPTGWECWEWCYTSL